MMTYFFRVWELSEFHVLICIVDDSRSLKKPIFLPKITARYFVEFELVVFFYSYSTSCVQTSDILPVSHASGAVNRHIFVPYICQRWLISFHLLYRKIQEDGVLVLFQNSTKICHTSRFLRAIVWAR